MLPRLVTAFVGTFSSTLGAIRTRGNDTTGTKSLEAVLAAHADLSIYYGLWKQFPNVFSDLPKGGVTIIVPTNNAFARVHDWDKVSKAAQAAWLQYHMLQGSVSMSSVPDGKLIFPKTLLTSSAFANVTNGQDVMVTRQAGDVVVFISGMGSRATLLDADLAFDGGLVHLVDSPLTAPRRLEPTAREAYSDLTAFLGALYATGLVEEMAQTHDATIFAPRNTAFQRVAGVLETMDRDTLTRVLRYHMIPGRVLRSEDLGGSREDNFDTAAAADVEGGSPGLAQVHISRLANDAFVGAARVIQPDILVANGMVHIIDAVLNPDAAVARPDPNARSGHVAVFDDVDGGATSVGPRVPTPFTSALPCTGSECRATSTTPARSSTRVAATTTRGVVASSSSSGAAVTAVGRRAAIGLGVGAAIGLLAGP